MSKNLKNRNKILTDIQTYLFPEWDKNCVDEDVNETLNRHSHWRKMISELYHAKALNLQYLYKQIDYIRGGKCI